MRLHACSCRPYLVPMASSALEAACNCLQVATLEGQLKETEERASAAEQLLTITQVGLPLHCASPIFCTVHGVAAAAIRGVSVPELSLGSYLKSPAHACSSCEGSLSRLSSSAANALVRACAAGRA